jgi:hypothetical protein
MPQISWMNAKQKLEKPTKVKVFNFLEKLQENDAIPGLHIEPMQNAADARARTGRVDQGLRAVLYRIEVEPGGPLYVYIGTYEHDEAIEIARTRVLRVNPINGVTELINAGAPEPVLTTAPVVAESSTGPSAADASATVALLVEHGYVVEDLTQQLGFDDRTAVALLAVPDEDALLLLGETLPNQWEQNAVLGLAVGDSIETIKTSLGLGAPVAAETSGEASVDVTVDVGDRGGVGAPATTLEPTVSPDDELVASLQRPASRMQFTLIEDNAELRRVIDGGDFGAWRVFLHPEQRAYASRSYNGPFRLSGGAGTGKTVVLLHRARALAARYPGSRIALTTFTRALSTALDRDVQRLDPSLERSRRLGAPGVLTSGVDQLAAAVRDNASKDDWATAMSAVLGHSVEGSVELVSNDHGWLEAIDDADVVLPEELATTSFLEAEYLQVILPNRITTGDEYRAVRRAGRGIALDRARRNAVWKVVERFRANARSLGRLSWAELSSVAAAHLAAHPSERPIDHLLIDEAQDLTPSQWQLLRELVPEGKDDLFIAEDTHQRIYGQHVVLSRYGIKITGRSRRLTLNYRTTQQNLQWALGVLKGGSFEDSEGIVESAHGYRSARRGPAPELHGAATPADLFTFVADRVRSWLDAGVAPETIAVLVRGKKQASAVVQQLSAKGVSVSDMDAARGLPQVMTMHRAKGMEFSRVVMFDVTDGVIPSPWALRDKTGDDLDDAMLRERSLLYVAASRARDELVVTWRGERSPLLEPGLRA